MTNRRNVLLSLSKFGLLASIGPGFFSYLQAKETGHRGNGSVLLGGQYELPDDFSGSLFLPNQAFKNKRIFSWNVKKNKFESAEILVPAHCSQPHPTEHSLVGCSSRASDNLCLFDWSSKKKISSYVFQNSNYAYGHLAFNKTGTLMLATAVKNKKGSIYVFEVPSLKVVDVISMGNFTAHDIVDVEDNKFVLGLTELAVDKANVGLFNLSDRSFKVFSRNFEKKTGMLSVNHLKRHGDKVFAGFNLLDNSPMTNGNMLTFDYKTGAFKSTFIEATQGVGSEIQNIEYDPETNFAWISFPDLACVIVWDLKHDKLAFKIDIETKPHSISLLEQIDAMIIGSHFFLAFDRKTGKRLTALDSKWSNYDLRNTKVVHTRVI